jgi:hypothetical protein
MSRECGDMLHLGGQVNHVHHRLIGTQQSISRTVETICAYALQVRCQHNLYNDIVPRHHTITGTVAALHCSLIDWL